jgi:hypothetical protein
MAQVKYEEVPVPVSTTRRYTVALSQGEADILVALMGHVAVQKDDYLWRIMKAFEEAGVVYGKLPMAVRNSLTGSVMVVVDE